MLSLDQELIENTDNGIQRPLEKMVEVAGSNISRGIDVSAIDRDKKWEFVPKVSVGDAVQTGDIIGTVQETVVVEHRIMVPVGVKGTVKEIKSGEFTVEETVCVLTLEDGSEKELTMMQKWPVRVARPYKKKN